LRGELQATFYHGAPLVDDQSAMELLALHEHGVFTNNGQGSLCPSAADVEERPARLWIGVNGSRKGSQLRVETHGWAPYFPDEALVTFQRAYLCALVPRALVKRITAGLRAEADEVSGWIFDVDMEEEIFKSDRMPERGTVTIQRWAPTRAEIDLTVPKKPERNYAMTDSDMAEWCEDDILIMGEALAPGIADAIIEEEGLCFMKLEENAFCAGYPRSLPARLLLLWLTAA
jgi:hypothetical protein